MPKCWTVGDLPEVPRGRGIALDDPARVQRAEPREASQSRPALRLGMVSLIFYRVSPPVETPSVADVSPSPHFASILAISFSRAPTFAALRKRSDGSAGYH